MATKSVARKRPASPTPTKPRARAAKRPAKAAPVPAPGPVLPLVDGVGTQMRAAALRMLEAGAGAIIAGQGLRLASSAAKALGDGAPLQAARFVLGALGGADTSRTARAGTVLRRLRESAGLTLDDVGHALNLKDPSLLEALEGGRIALPFELILRLAAVLGRNDPVGFVMKLTRSANPELWKSLESLGVGRLVLQSAREREFANIYRADDGARQLSDEDFAIVLAFTKAAFETAMALRQKLR
jgi:transcriptional regulator with XRE-family HTH domain